MKKEIKTTVFFIITGIILFLLSSCTMIKQCPAYGNRISSGVYSNGKSYIEKQTGEKKYKTTWRNK